MQLGIGKVPGEYFGGYLTEKSLSIDNIFVFAILFRAFAVPAAYQRRVLFYGVFGALVLRGVLIAAGASASRPLPLGPLRPWRSVDPFGDPAWHAGAISSIQTETS